MIFSKVENGKLNPYASKALVQKIGEFEGKWVEITVKVKRRSTAQNKYRWGVVVDRIKDFLNQWLEQSGYSAVHGITVKVTSKAADKFMKKEGLGIIHTIKTPYGEFEIEGELKDQTAAEFENTMEAVRAWAATDLGLEIPLPNEDMLNEWYSENLERK